MLRSSVSSPRSCSRQQFAIFGNLGNHVHSISASTGHPAGPSAAALTAAPTMAMLNTSNQQFLNQSSELWAHTEPNPALSIGGSQEYSGSQTQEYSQATGNLGNLVHSISASTGQSAGPFAAALANVVAAPTMAMLSTSSQQFLNQPSELWPQIEANPALSLGRSQKYPQTTGNLGNLVHSISASTRQSAGPSAAAPLDASANSVVRTPEEIQQEMSKVMIAQGISFPSGFPKGPWKTPEEAKNCINKCYAQQTSTGCGAFTVVFRTSVSTSSASKRSKKGNRRLLVCDHQRHHKSKSTGLRNGNFSKRTGCPWGIWIEESTEGWIPAAYNRASIAAAVKEKAADAETIHNHELIVKESEKRSVAALRYIPEKILHLCDHLAEGHLKPAKIYESAKEKCAELGIEVNFTLKDFQNRYRVDPAAVKAALDTTELFNYLKDKYASDTSRPFDQKIGSSGSIDDFFFVLPGGSDNFRLSKKIVLYDTKHGMTKYGFKVGTYSTVDNHGKTQIIAVDAHRVEDEESFRWGFSVFTKNLGESPSIIFTDSDPAMKAAIAKEWPETIHLLCIFHLFKNFYEHCKKAFMGRDQEWSDIARRWWRLCKKSDSRFVPDFYSEWDSLADDIMTAAGSSIKDEKKRGLLQKWLNGMRDRANQWAACMTYQHMTFGIHSTQRAEAIHSVMQRRFADKNSTFLQLVKDLERMDAENDFRSKDAEFRENLRRNMQQTTGNSPNISPFGEGYGRDVTGHARHLITAQCSNLIHFRVSPIGPSDVEIGQQQFLTQRWIAEEDDPEDLNPILLKVDYGLKYCYDECGHITTLKGCTCQFPSCHGMACAHMWAVVQQLNREDVLEHLMPCDAFYRKSSNKPLQIQIQATAVSEYAHMPPHLATKESRRIHLMQACSVLADHASNSVSNTESFHRLLTDCLQNYQKENCINICDTARLIPNPQILGKKQNQKRKQPIAGPTTATAHKQRREAKRNKKNEQSEKAKLLTGRD